MEQQTNGNGSKKRKEKKKRLNQKTEAYTNKS